MDNTASRIILLDRHKTADYLGISVRKVDYLRARNELPCIKLGKRTLFRKQDIDAYIRKNRVVSTDETNGPTKEMQAKAFPYTIWANRWCKA